MRSWLVTGACLRACLLRLVAGGCLYQPCCAWSLVLARARVCGATKVVHMLTRMAAFWLPVAARSRASALGLDTLRVGGSSVGMGH